MKSLKSALQLNVLIEMAVADCEFKQLLMRDPLEAAHEYNRQMAVDSSPICTLPRLEVEMLQHVAGATTDFRQFCRLLIEERDRFEREEQRRALAVVGSGTLGNYQPEAARSLRSA